MSVTEVITKQINKKDFLLHYGFKRISEHGEQLRAICAIHDGNNPMSFTMNQYTGMWYCHSCSEGGDMISVVQKIYNLDFKSAIHKIAKDFNIDLTGISIDIRAEKERKKIREWLEYMRRKKKKLIITPFEVEGPTTSVTTFRDFTQETLQHFQLQSITSIELPKRDGSMFTLHNRWLIPIHFKHTQIGVSLRRQCETDNPKWFHVPRGINVGSILYNFDNIEDASSVVVCEGMFDVWAFHEIGIPAVAVFGAHISKEQYKLLLSTGADIVLAFDGDDAGRKATRDAYKMLHNKVNLSYIQFNEGEDPCSIERSSLLELYNNRQKV